MLNLNQLAQFLSIARTGSLVAAAEALGLTSAGLSKNLAALERQTGARLFDRVGRGLQLTGVGTEFAKQVEELLGHAETVSESLKASMEGSAGRLRIGSGPAALQGPVANAIDAFMAAHPKVALEIETGNSTDLLLGLRQYQYEFLVSDRGSVVGNTEHQRYLVQPLAAEPVVLICSRKHPLLASRRKIQLSDALEYPWVAPQPPTLMRHRLAEQLRAEHAPAIAFNRLAVVPNVRIEDMNSCMQVCADSHCITVALHSKVRSRGFPGSLARLPINLNLQTAIAVISLQQRTPTPLAARLMASLTGSVNPETGKRRT